MKRHFPLLLILLLSLLFCACASSDYRAASELQSTGEYAAAQAAFRVLGDYKDSRQLADECGYAVAAALFEAEDYQSAADAFLALGDYSDSASQMQECSYRIASALLDSCDYTGAMDAFAKLGDYRDSKARAAAASDAYLTQALFGSWTSDLVDESDIFLSEDLFSGEEGEEMKPYFHFEPFVNRYELSLPEDGSYTLSVDTDVFAGSADAMLKSMREGFHTYFTESMKQALTADGLSLEDAYKVFGVDNMDGVIEASLGMPLDAFIDLAFPRDSLLALAENSDETGTLSVENGIVLLKNELEEISGAYDPATDTLTLQDESRMIPFHRNKNN